MTLTYEDGRIRIASLLKYTNSAAPQCFLVACSFFTVAALF